MPTISIIVPVYNVEKYLNRCVDSILNQTFTDFELILVDDGSPDNCGKICDEYAKTDQRVKVIHKSNGGLSSARNVGLDYIYKYSEFDLLGFVDSDDWIHPQMYELLYFIMKKYNANMSVCSYLDIDKRQEINYENFSDKVDVSSCCLDKEKALESLFTAGNDMFGLVMPKLYKKELFLNRRFEEGIIYEDVKSSFRVLYDADKIAVTYEKLYFYYHNPQGITKSDYSKKRLDIIPAMEEQINFFKEKNYSNIYELGVRKYLYLLTYHRKLAFNSLKDKEIDHMIKKKMKNLFWKEKRNCHITPQNSPDCYNELFPKFMWLYWAVKAQINKIKK